MTLLSKTQALNNLYSILYYCNSEVAAGGAVRGAEIPSTQTKQHNIRTNKLFVILELTTEHNYISIGTFIHK